MDALAWNVGLDKKPSVTDKKEKKKQKKNKKKRSRKKRQPGRPRYEFPSWASGRRVSFRFCFVFWLLILFQRDPLGTRAGVFRVEAEVRQLFFFLWVSPLFFCLRLVLMCLPFFFFFFFFFFIFFFFLFPCPNITSSNLVIIVLLLPGFTGFPRSSLLLLSREKENLMEPFVFCCFVVSTDRFLIDDGRPLVSFFFLWSAPIRTYFR